MNHLKTTAQHSAACGALKHLKFAFALPLLILIGCSVTSQSVPTRSSSQNPVQQEIEMLQGTWRAFTVEYRGEVEGSTIANRTSLTFRGHSLTVTHRDAIAAKGMFKLNMSTNPKTIEFLVEEGAPKVKGKTMFGIYTFEGETLKWALSDAGNSEFPKGFFTSKDTEYTLINLKREKLQ